MMKLNHKIYGQGDPIIILHGLFGMLDNWKTVASVLAEKYMVILVDQRNHGRSPHEEEINYPLMSADLKSFMEENWIHKAHIMGHSMGGKTAIQFAHDYPDMVDKLIVVDIGIKKYPTGHEKIFDALLGLDPSAVESRSEAEKILSQKIREKSVVLFLMKNLTRSKNGNYEWKMNLPAIHEHYDEILAEIQIKHKIELPTLFINGTKSKYIVEEDIPSIKEHFSHAQFDSLDAGHWVHAEKMEELIGSVMNFLES